MTNLLADTHLYLTTFQPNFGLDGMIISMRVILPTITLERSLQKRSGGHGMLGNLMGVCLRIVLWFGQTGMHGMTSCALKRLKHFAMFNHGQL